MWAVGARMEDALDDAHPRLPTLPGSAPTEKRTHPARCPAGAVRGLPAHVYPPAQGTALRAEVQRPGARRLPGPHELARHPAYLRGVL